MKITILIMTVCLMQVSALTKAQISIDAKQESLRKVLEKISQQSGYDFVYSVPDFKDAKPVDLKLNNVSLDLALRAAFYSQPLIYEVSENTVMVRKKEEKSYIQTVIDRFQAIDVRGKVVDSLGNGLAGATVSVKGGKGSTSTNNNGDFVLRNIPDEAVLIVNYLGYEVKEQSVNKDFVYIQLSPSASPLDEVQIMAYGKTSRRLSTSTITTITAEEIGRQPVNNPLLALQGKVPNLIITPQSGRPGAPISLQLRGQNSIAEDPTLPIDALTSNRRAVTEPLIVVDGIPFTNNINGFGALENGQTLNRVSALSFINPADIESISVLTDADATSIYGSRGGNGVILINTKKGGSGEMKININASRGYSDVAKKMDLLSTGEYFDLRNQAYANDLLIAPNSSIPANQKNNSNYDLTVWDKNRYTDWQQIFLGGSSKDYNFSSSLTGGTTNLRYLLSGTYSDQGSVLPGKYKNQSANGHVSISGNSSNGKFAANIQGGYTSNIRSNPSTDLTRLAITLAPNAPNLYQTNGTLNWEPDPRTGRATWTNPYSRLQLGTDEKTNSLHANAMVSYEIISNLRLKSTFGLNRTDLKSIFVNPISAKDPSNIANTGSAIRNLNLSKSASFEPQIDYSFKISHGRVESLIGYSLQSQAVESEYISASGYTDDALIRNLALVPVNSANLSVRNSSSQYKYSALFGRLGYNWENKYLLNFSLRRDGSSRFGPNNQYGNFWSLAGGWIISEEKFFKSLLPIISYAKIRSSYGSSGNDGIGDYRYLELYDALGFTYQGLQTIKSAGVNNPYYHWEQIHKAEFGAEIGVLKDRLLLSALHFRNKSSDQLSQSPLPATAGGNSLTVNLPTTIQNMGWEFTLSSKNISTKNFAWQTNANLGFQRNKLLKRASNGAFDFSLDPRIKEGDPFSGYVYVLEYKGVNPVTGLYQFLDESGNITSTPSTIFFSKTSKKIMIQPKFSGGLNNSFSFKNFNLTVFLEFKKQNGKNYLFDPAFDGAGGFSNGTIGNLPKEYLSAWSPNNNQSVLQRLSTSVNPLVNSSIVARSDGGWVDASYIRLNNISLSYSLAKLMQKTKISNLTFVLNIQNLYTFTKYKGLDPQTQSATVLPQLRSLTAGIQLSF